MITIIVENGGRRESFSFPGPTVSVGRAEDNDLRIGSRFVSQHHCRVELLADQGVKLVDLDSQNGTRVNGNRITEMVLGEGDRIQIGETSLVVEAALAEAGARS